MRLPAENVRIGKRLRPLNPAKVEALIVSYRETGALPPILTRTTTDEDELGRPIVVLVAGLHRLDACRQLGIPADCMVREMSDAEALLTEIDENLLGPDLSPLDRAVFVEARLKVWTAANPDRTKAAADGLLRPKRGRPSNSEKFSEFTPSMGFAAETAAEIGLTDKSVRNALTIARGLTQATHSAVAGTWVARSEGTLRQLAGITDPKEQQRVVRQLLNGTKSVSDARALAAGNTPVKPSESPVDETVKALEKLWKAAPPTHRAAMLHWLQGQPLPKPYRLTSERSDG